MSNYVKSTNFYAKDALVSGNPDKIIKGAEIDDEFNNLATAISTKADLNSPTFTGIPLAPTAAANTNTTQVATTAFVTSVVNTLGTMSTQNKTAVDITGGTVVGITDLAVADGGTGVSSLTAKAVLIGNGTSPINFVSPGSSGNLLTSNGTDWVSQALSSSLSANGYVKLPGGITVAWGSMSTSNSGGSNNNFYTISGSATLPVTFTNVYKAIVGFGSTGVFYGASIGVDTLTTTTLSVAGASPYGGGNPTVNYLVIGTS